MASQICVFTCLICFREVLTQNAKLSETRKKWRLFTTSIVSLIRVSYYQNHLLVMRTFLLFAYLATITLAASLFQRKQYEARVCDPDPLSGRDRKYTGSRIDRQVVIDHDKVTSIQLHLSFCEKGLLVSKYIKDESLPQVKKTVGELSHFDDVIPWNQTLCDASSPKTCFKLARKKAYALRPISIYNPGDFVGGLFELVNDVGGKLKDSIDGNYVPVGKLIADSIHNQWLEVHKDSKLKIYHIPLLFTPNVENGGSNNSKDVWFSSISANELYDYSIETKNMIRSSFDLSMSQVKNIVKNSSKKLKGLNALLSDSKPIRKSIKSINVPRTINFLTLIFKDKIDDLAKFRFNKDQIDFDTMMVISQILSREQFKKLLGNLNAVYNKLQIPEQMFSYPKMKLFTKELA